MDAATLGAALAIANKRIDAVEQEFESLNLAYSYKGSVASVADLPGDPETGDLYTIDGTQWVWDGTEWISMSITNAQIDGLFEEEE